MNTIRVFWIMRKETLEVIKDRRALLGMTIFPLVFLPLVSQFPLIGLSPSIAKYKIAIMNQDNGPLSNQIVQLFKMTNGTEVLLIYDIPPDIEEKLKSSTFDVVVIIPPNFSLNITSGLQSRVIVMVYPASTRSTMALLVLEKIIFSFEDVLVAQRLAYVKLEREFIDPIDLNVTSIGKTGAIQSELSFMSSFFLVISTFTSMLGIGLEKSAGEKDKGTIEVLLASPASRKEILVGKLLSLLPFAVLSLLATIIGLTVGGLIGSRIMGQVPGQVQLMGFDPTYVSIIIVIAPIFLSQAAALILMIGFFARTLKEAQTYMSVTTTLLSFGTIIVFFLPTYISRWICLIPIMGVTILQNFYISEGFSTFILSVILAQIIYLIVFLILTLRIMQAERLIAPSD